MIKIRLIILFTIIFVVFAYFYNTYILKNYRAGKYGKNCYEVGQEHKNIKYPIKFNNKIDCLIYINP